MPRNIDGKQYFTLHEVCEKTGVSRSTLWRWSKKDTFYDSRYRDRNGWRVWSEDEVETLNKRFNALYLK